MLYYLDSSRKQGDTALLEHLLIFQHFHCQLLFLGTISLNVVSFVGLVLFCFVLLKLRANKWELNIDRGSIPRRHKALYKILCSRMALLIFFHHKYSDLIQLQKCYAARERMKTSVCWNVFLWKTAIFKSWFLVLWVFFCFPACFFWRMLSL